RTEVTGAGGGPDGRHRTGFGRRRRRRREFRQAAVAATDPASEAAVVARAPGQGVVVVLAFGGGADPSEVEADTARSGQDAGGDVGHGHRRAEVAGGGEEAADDRVPQGLEVTDDRAEHLAPEGRIGEAEAHGGDVDDAVDVLQVRCHEGDAGGRERDVERRQRVGQRRGARPGSAGDLRQRRRPRRGGQRLAVEERGADGETPVGPGTVAGPLRDLPAEVVEDDLPAEEAQAVDGGDGVGLAGLVVEDAGAGLGAAVDRLGHRAEGQAPAGGRGPARGGVVGRHLLVLEGAADRPAVGEVTLVDLAPLGRVLVPGRDRDRRDERERRAGPVAPAGALGRGGQAAGGTSAARALPAAGGLEPAAAAAVGAVLRRGLHAAAGGRGRQALVGDEGLAEVDRDLEAAGAGG